MMSDIKVMFGEVMHRRLFPRVNGFRYPIFYLSVPIMPDMPARGDWRVGINRRALMSFYDIDHGDRTPGNLHRWIMSILTDHGVADITDIRLICLPRTMGYVFNPVSFWMCRDQSGDLRAVLCEVNNTFGETHAYLCVPSPGEKISAETRVQAQKLFHVSPFLPREGHYQFRFDDRPDKTGMWIDYYDGSGEKQVLTALTGSWEAYSPPPVAAYVFWVSVGDGHGHDPHPSSGFDIMVQKTEIFYQTLAFEPENYHVGSGSKDHKVISFGI